MVSPGNGLQTCFLVFLRVLCAIAGCTVCVCVYNASSLCMSGTQYLASDIQAGKVWGPTLWGISLVSAGC